MPVRREDERRVSPPPGPPGGSRRGRSARRRRAAVLAGVAALAALAAFAAAPAWRRPAPEVLTVGVARQPAFALVFVAQAKGYFAAEGVRVAERRYTSGRDALDGLLRGEVDAATAFDAPVVARAALAPDLEVLTTLHLASRYTRLVARRDRGIATEADLAGKRVAVPAHTSAEVLLHHLLRMGGVARSEVGVADLGPDAAVDALVAGEVDAIASWTPYAERAVEALGAGATIEIASDVYTEASMLVTRTATRRARAEALVRFVRGLARAEHLARTRPAEALAALGGELPELGAAELRARWDRQTLTLGLSELLAQVLLGAADGLRAAGGAGAEALDVDRLLVPDVLARVDDEAVTFAGGAAGSQPR